MSTEDIRQVILEILERIAPDEDLTDLKDDVPFRDQMELDSMDFLDIVMELRKMSVQSFRRDIGSDCLSD